MNIKGKPDGKKKNVVLFKYKKYTPYANALDELSNIIEGMRDPYTEISDHDVIQKILDVKSIADTIKQGVVAEKQRIHKEEQKKERAKEVT